MVTDLRLGFYGADFTGSPDALEALASAGLRTALFVAPPTDAQLARFGGLEAVGVAGGTRALAATSRTIVLNALSANWSACCPRLFPWMRFIWISTAPCVRRRFPTRKANCCAGYALVSVPIYPW